MKTNVTCALGILTIVFHKTNLVSRSKSALLLYGFERCSHRLHYGKCRTLEFWSLPHTTSQEVSDAPVCKMFNPGLVGGSQELDVNTHMFLLWFQTTLCFLLSRQRYMHTCTLKVKRCDTFFMLREFYRQNVAFLWMDTQRRASQGPRWRLLIKNWRVLSHPERSIHPHHTLDCRCMSQRSQCGIFQTGVLKSEEKPVNTPFYLLVK